MLVVALAALACSSAPAVDSGGIDAALAAAVDDMASLDLTPPQLAATNDGRRSTSSTSRSSSSAGGSNFEPAGAAATPQGRTFGIGLQLGYPTALTIKYMLRPDQGIVAGVGGFSGFAYDVGAFSLHVDYVYHPMLLTAGEAYQVTWYVGGGGNLIVFNNPRQRTFLPGVTYYYYPTNIWLAARVPLGLNLALTQVPFEIYLEAVPSVLVFPSLSFGLGFAIGGRFYF